MGEHRANPRALPKLNGGTGQPEADFVLGAGLVARALPNAGAAEKLKARDEEMAALVAQGLAVEPMDLGPEDLDLVVSITVDIGKPNRFAMDSQILGSRKHVEIFREPMVEAIARAETAVRGAAKDVVGATMTPEQLAAIKAG